MMIFASKKEWTKNSWYKNQVILKWPEQKVF